MSTTQPPAELVRHPREVIEAAHHVARRCSTEAENLLLLSIYPDFGQVSSAAMSVLSDALACAEADLETERLRLAACGVIALSDTPESAAKAREMKPEYRSGSLQDVERRVDECIRLRANLAAERQRREKAEADLVEVQKHSVVWSPAPVPKYIAEEWFLAKVKFGSREDRVVLTALPEEYAFQYKTADQTHIKSECVVAWAQFPDTEYSTPLDELATERQRREKAERELAEARALLASPGIAAFARERLAHTTREGWTPEHDDTHTDQSIARAASVYAMPVHCREEWAHFEEGTSGNKSWVARTVRDFLWVWSEFWYKPEAARKRELEKAGALLAAEWDRLDRAEKKAAREAGKGTT